MIKPSQIKSNKNQLLSIFKKFNSTLNEKNIDFFLSEVLSNVTVIKEKGDDKIDNFLDDLYYFENYK